MCNSMNTIQPLSSIIHQCQMNNHIFYSNNHDEICTFNPSNSSTSTFKLDFEPKSTVSFIKIHNGNQFLIGFTSGSFLIMQEPTFQVLIEKKWDSYLHTKQSVIHVESNLINICILTSRLTIAVFSYQFKSNELRLIHLQRTLLLYDLLSMKFDTNDDDLTNSISLIISYGTGYPLERQKTYVGSRDSSKLFSNKISSSTDTSSEWIQHSEITSKYATNRILITGHSNNTIHIFDISQSKFIHKSLIYGHTSSVTALMYEENDNFLYSAGKDGVKVWVCTAHRLQLHYSFNFEGNLTIYIPQVNFISFSFISSL